MLIVFKLDPVDDLCNAILRIVAEKPGITVADLHVALKKAKQNVTLQHLYRRVNLLVDEEALLKQKGALTMNLMWLSYLTFFANKAKDELAKDAASQVFPLKPGQRVSFPASTVGEVQTMWHHLLIQLHRVEPQTSLYKYYSHAWWVWNTRTLDVNFYKKIYEKGVRCLWLYGGNTYLDRAAVKMHPGILESRIATDAPFPHDGYNLNVYGDYVFECTFPANIARHLELVFHSVKTSGQDDRVFVDDVFAMKGEFTVTVWRNPRLAADLRGKIGRYFLPGGKVMPEDQET